MLLREIVADYLEHHMKQTNPTGSFEARCIYIYHYASTDE
jgi:hypothetical protein